MTNVFFKFKKTYFWPISPIFGAKTFLPKTSNDDDDEQAMHLMSDKIEVVTYDNTNEVIEEISESFLSRHQIGLETSMKGSNFIF